MRLARCTSRPATQAAWRTESRTACTGPAGATRHDLFPKRVLASRFSSPPHTRLPVKGFVTCLSLPNTSEVHTALVLHQPSQPRSSHPGGGRSRRRRAGRSRCGQSVPTNPGPGVGAGLEETARPDPGNPNSSACSDGAMRTLPGLHQALSRPSPVEKSVTAHHGGPLSPESAGQPALSGAGLAAHTPRAAARAPWELPGPPAAPSPRSLEFSPRPPGGARAATAPDLTPRFWKELAMLPLL